MSGAREKKDQVLRAQEAWAAQGKDVPEWVLAIAEDCNRTSQAHVARKMGFSASTINTVIIGTYGAETTKVQGVAEGVYMSAKVDCPVLGEIGRDYCLEQQDIPFSASSSMRAQIHRACRSGCPHSKFTAKEEAS